MPSEHDLELLETLLDGELPAGEAAALRTRVASDPALAEAMQRVRTDREIRSQMWRAMEPQESEVANLLSGVHGQIRRDEAWAMRLRAVRYASALAACILCGFLMGRFIPYPNGSDRGTGIVYDAGRGPMMEVADQRGDAPATSRPQGFKVLLTDERGRVIAEQRFATFSEAREFTDDLSRAQQPRGGAAGNGTFTGNARRPLQPPQPQQSPSLVNDTFYIKGEF